jgi:tetratricopeptide (TPR) repeat protein
MCSKRALLLVLMHMVSFTGVAAAQTLDQQRCFARDPDLSIGGCTAMIQSGQETQENLDRAFSHRGLAYARKGQHDRAIQDLDQAIGSTRMMPWPSVAGVSSTLAWAKTIAPFRTSMKPSGSTRILPMSSATGVLSTLARGQDDRAIDDYDHAIRLNPNDARAFSNRGNAYARKGQDDRAIEDYDQAIRLNPNLAEAFGDRGIAYSRKGQYDRAIEDFDQVIRLNPKDAEAFYNRGLALRELGQQARAAADFAKARQLNSNPPPPTTITVLVQALFKMR